MCDYFSRFNLHGLTRSAVSFILLFSVRLHQLSSLQALPGSIESARPEDFSVAAIYIRCSKI